MNKAFICLTTEAYDVIHKLNRKGLILNKTYNKLEECESFDEVLDTMYKDFSIPPGSYTCIWDWIRQKFWDWDRNNKEVCTVFNPRQNIFMEHLLKRGGVYEKEECQRQLLTDQQIKDDIGKLEEWELIIALRIKKNFGKETIFIIHPEVVKNTFGKNEK